MTLLLKLISLSMLFGASMQQSTPESSTYSAGVVEYHVNQINPSMTDVENFQQNANNYVKIIRSPDAANVDIIVFPESTLNSIPTAVIVPTETENVDLCADSSYNENLRNIACAARNVQKYVVINLTMKRNCIYEREMADDPEHEEISAADCPSEWVLYNTNVVLDRDGRVLSIYRKYNLFGEPGITAPISPDISTFTTDFDVTFGHFICFDLLFQSPALDLIDQGIKNIIFPTMWFSELPFLTSVQIQQNWAHANNVNLLAAGANQPKVGSSGSGIYSGVKGALISTITGAKATKLLVHEVPKTPGTLSSTSPAYSGTDLGELLLERDHLDLYEWEKIELPESSSTPLKHTFEICQSFEEELCCDFGISLMLRPVSQNSVSYNYFAVVYNGVRRFNGTANGGIQSCAVIACLDDDLSTCGTVYGPNELVDSKVSFSNIVISGKFPTENVLIMPSSLNFNVSPYSTLDYSYNKSMDQGFDQGLATRNVTMSLLTAKADLLTFGIYARDFRYSGCDKQVTSTILILIFVAICNYLVT